MKSNPARFRQLYDDYSKLVRSVIYQIAGSSHLNDLVQEAFIKIWKGLPEFQEQSQLSTWIYRIATNVALDALRSWSRRKENFEYDFSQLQDERNTADQDYENRQIVQLGLQQLTEQHRSVLVLAYIHERPIAEIADILSVSEGTVKSRLHYAKEAFQNFLNQKGVKL